MSQKHLETLFKQELKAKSMGVSKVRAIVLD